MKPRHNPDAGLTRRSALTRAAGLLPLVNLSPMGADPIEVAGLKDFAAGRITSADPTGGNEDMRRLEPGATLEIANIPGAGCIVQWRDNITSSEPHHLQLHTLRMYWDGETDPSVAAPVGDFFAVGFGFTTRVDSAFVCIDQSRGSVTDPAANGAARTAYFPMPFARGARITITNEGREPSLHWFEVNYRSYGQLPPGLGRFHASYRQGTPPPTGPVELLRTEGRGHLVGCALSVFNRDGGWWGEGDEIVEIDGREAMHGTGSEDYFGQSYGLHEGCFPFFGSTIVRDPYASAYRWHIPDPVPFRHSLRFAIEQGNGTPPFTSGNYYYSVAYWYQAGRRHPLPVLPPPDERVSWSARR